jgi:ribosomal protein S18 acetylase RimI-like enzyme
MRATASRETRPHAKPHAHLSVDAAFARGLVFGPGAILLHLLSTEWRNSMERDIRIRDARREDVDAIMILLVRLDAHVAGVPADELALSESGEAHLRRNTQRFLDADDRRLVVAEAPDGTVVGMGSIEIWYYENTWLNPERRDLRAANIDDFWVEPDWRGHGIARRIVARLLSFAAESEVEELVLEYALHNTEAASFWERLGFRAAARLSEVLPKLPAPEETGRRRKKKEKK